MDEFSDQICDDVLYLFNWIRQLMTKSSNVKASRIFYSAKLASLSSETSDLLGVYLYLIAVTSLRSKIIIL